MGLSACRDSAGIVDRSGRGILHFKGEQSHWFLDQLVTNKVEGLEAAQGAEALLLTPKGRIVATMRLVSSGKAVHCDVDPGRAQELREFFEAKVFATKVEIADRTEEFAILGVLGPQSDSIVERALKEFVSGESQEDRDLGTTTPSEDEHHTTHFGSAALVRVTRPIRGIDLWVRRESAAQIAGLLERSGAEPVSSDDYAALCAIEGLPRFGVDFDDGYLPQEACLERVVDFAKGCYLGQEAVAMAQRGDVKRRLRHLTFEGPPLMGTVIFGEQDAGRVTSIGNEGDRGFGIATVKTSVEVGSVVEVVSQSGGSARAVVHRLPGTIEGPKVPSARELRERLQGSR